jgi:predicted small metal-binding protein
MGATRGARKGDSMTQHRETTSQWQVTCQCGWRVHGTKEIVVSAVKEHGRSTHQLELTEEQVMAQAVPAERS